MKEWGLALDGHSTLHDHQVLELQARGTKNLARRVIERCTAKR